MKGEAAPTPAELARSLAHDVGKYVARAARNLPAEGPIPSVLVDMLRRDVRAPLPSGVLPRARFDELARTLPDRAELDEVRAAFDAIDARAAALEAGDTATVREVAAHARAIEAALRTLARALSEAER